MEFDILNGIMTATVAQLFTINRLQPHHPGDPNESKIDIPINRTSSLSNAASKDQ